MSLNFDSVFGNECVSIKCPKCKADIKITLNQVGSTICCPSCNSSIELKASDSFNSSKASIDNSLKDLNKTIKNFGK
ncbi:hypothetical protein [Clostridium baratii]|uniref:hypothetical protein n=1 Tax=Clostridium baratii TaxID=1561 RepID=UPI0030D22314